MLAIARFKTDAIVRLQAVHSRCLPGCQAGEVQGRRLVIRFPGPPEPLGESEPKPMVEGPAALSERAMMLQVRAVEWPRGPFGR